MHTLPSVTPDRHDAIAEALRSAGMCLVNGLPDAATTQSLREDLHRLRDAGALLPAGTGRHQGHALRPELRGDRTLWLDDPRCSPAAGEYLSQLDALRVALNRRLFLGLEEVEAHYACYAPGTGYGRHRDRFRDSDARVVSLVSYLNDDWQQADGGQLRLHLEDATLDVVPLGATSICFLSELEHEVLPALRERLSIAAWFRKRAG